MRFIRPPTLLARALLVAVLTLTGVPWALAQQNQSLLQITSPADGTVVNPGQTVTVVVTAATGVNLSAVAVVAEDPIGFSAVVTQAPFQVTVTIPSTIMVGPYHFTAIGNGGASLIQSESVTLDVERPDAPQKLLVQPSQLTFESQGELVPLLVSGTFSDGSVLDLTQSKNVTYSSANEGIATVDMNGSVTAAAAGATSITVSYGPSNPGIQVTVPVTVPAPMLSPSPPTLAFGSQDVSSSSSVQTVTLTNTSKQLVQVLRISAAGDFAETDTCVSMTSISPGGSCTANVAFTPTANGTRAGALNIWNSFTVAPLTVPLSGTGVGPSVALSGISFTFNGQQVGSSSAPVALTITNSGGGQLSISAIQPPAGFRETDTCGTAPLSSNGTCTVNLTFMPSVVGITTGTLMITDNIVASPQLVYLAGNGTVPSTVVLSPTSLTFNTEAVGVAASPQQVTLKNTGSVTLTVSSMATTGTNAGDFGETNTCGTSLAVGGSCTITVTFMPTAAGSRTAAITIDDGSQDSPQTIPLTGTGGVPAVSLSPSTFPAFAAQGVGTKSTAQSVTLTNTGSAALSVTSVAISGTNASEFSQTNTCGTSVAAGKTCAVTVTFTPSGINTRSATLTITDNNDAVAGSTQTVSLTGTGSAAEVTLGAVTPTIAAENVGTGSPASAVTLTNGGNASLTIESIAISGSDAKDFVMQSSSTCSTTAAVAAGKTCTVDVIFTPSAAGSRSATLTITDNANDAASAAQVVTLSGTGKDFALAVAAAPKISPGQTANYTLTLTPESGFSGTLQIMCSEPPTLTGSTCTASPASVDLNGTKTTTAISLTTTAASAARIEPFVGPTIERTHATGLPNAWHSLRWIAVVLLVPLLGRAKLAQKQLKRRLWILLLSAALFVTLWTSCGGGGGSGGGNVITPTAAGTYSITVTASSGNLSHSTTLTLTVQ